MKPCAPLPNDYFATAPVKLDVSVDVRASPGAVFACFRDAAAWPRWAPAITRVTWTTPPPFGVGTTRTVEMRGGMVGEEEFIAWEEGRRMAFRFTRSNVPVEAFGEDYLVETTGGGCTRVRWLMALTPSGFSAYTTPVFAPVLRAGNAWMLRRFARLVEAEYATRNET